MIVIFSLNHSLFINLLIFLFKKVRLTRFQTIVSEIQQLCQPVFEFTTIIINLCIFLLPLSIIFKKSLNTMIKMVNREKFMHFYKL